MAIWTKRNRRGRPRMRAAATVAALVAAGLTVSAPNARAEGICNNPPDRMLHLMSIANGLCVSVEFGWEGARHGTLRARAITPSSWENIKFLDLDARYPICQREAPAGWKCIGHGAISFEGETTDYRSARVVQVQWSSVPSLNGTLQLSKAPQPIVDLNSTQLFDRLVKNDRPGLPVKTALRSWSTGGFVSAELGWLGDDYGTLRARATTIGAWEEFLERS